jgi:hypothetical protein
MPPIETEGPPGTLVHAHTFRFITPAMTDKYKIPNPSTLCHKGKSTEWGTKEMLELEEHVCVACGSTITESTRTGLQNINDSPPLNPSL